MTPRSWMGRPAPLCSSCRGLGCPASGFYYPPPRIFVGGWKRREGFGVVWVFVGFLFCFAFSLPRCKVLWFFFFFGDGDRAVSATLLGFLPFVLLAGVVLQVVGWGSWSVLCIPSRCRHPVPSHSIQHPCRGPLEALGPDISGENTFKGGWKQSKGCGERRGMSRQWLQGCAVTHISHLGSGVHGDASVPLIQASPLSSLLVLLFGSSCLELLEAYFTLLDDEESSCASSARLFLLHFSPLKKGGNRKGSRRAKNKGEENVPPSARPAHLGWHEGFSAVFCLHPYSIKGRHKSPPHRLTES